MCQIQQLRPTELEKYDIKKYTTSSWAMGDENVIGMNSQNKYIDAKTALRLDLEFQVQQLFGMMSAYCN